MSEIYTIIVTHNGEQWISKCLDTLGAPEDAIRIVVVDNASMDKTVPLIREHRLYKRIRLVENHKNVGFGAANNSAVEYCLNHGAEHIFLLNQDAYMNQGEILRLADLQKRFKEYGIISPVHMDSSNSIESKFLEHISRTGGKVLEDIKCGGSVQELYEVEYVNAAMWMVSRATFCRVGMFSSIFFHYGEDDDFVNRCRYSGIKVGLAGRVRGIHDREERPYGRKRVYVAELIKLCNVNADFWKSLKRHNRTTARKLLRGAVRADLGMVSQSLYATARVYANLFDIHKTRLANRDRVASN